MYIGSDRVDRVNWIKCPGRTSELQRTHTRGGDQNRKLLVRKKSPCGPVRATLEHVDVLFLGQ
jgi:hypothetical protein